jgi:ribosomal silencing factor RsfS
MKLLDLPIPEYSREKDPTKLVSGHGGAYIDWTIPDNSVKIMRLLYEEKCCKQSKKRRLKPDIERRDDLGFEQQKIKKPKEEEICENNICALKTQDISDVTTEIVAHSLESKSNVTASVKDNQEYVRGSTEYEVKTEDDGEGNSIVIQRDTQDISPSEHLHEVGVIEVHS